MDTEAIKDATFDALGNGSKVCYIELLNFANEADGSNYPVALDILGFVGNVANPIRDYTDAAMTQIGES